MIKFKKIGALTVPRTVQDGDGSIELPDEVPGFFVIADAEVPGWGELAPADPGVIATYAGVNIYQFDDRESFDAAHAAYVVSAQVPPSQFDRDQTRYQRRAAVKDELIAWMAADNMSRVRSGVWSVADLQALLVDLGAVNGMMQTLSYEQAAQAIATAGNPLMTADIKAAWVGKLTEHFYLGA